MSQVFIKWTLWSIKHFQDHASYPGQHFSNRSTCPIDPTLQHPHQTIPAPPSQTSTDFHTSVMPAQTLCFPEMPFNSSFSAGSRKFTHHPESKSKGSNVNTFTAVLANLLHTAAHGEHGNICTAYWGKEQSCSQPEMTGRGIWLPQALSYAPTPSAIKRPRTTRQLSFT